MVHGLWGLTDYDLKILRSSQKPKIPIRDLERRMFKISFSKDLGNFVIGVPTFTTNFKVAKKTLEGLQRSSAGEKARDNSVEMNQTSNQLNERHSYPKDWFIELPSKPDSDGIRNGRLLPGSRV